jgi:Effector Associated Constant Component 1
VRNPPASISPLVKDLHHDFAVSLPSDYSQIDSLAGYLRLALPDVHVKRSPGQPGPGEQGALDVLTIATDSSVLVALINVLPTFLQSRKPHLSVTITAKGKKITVTGRNKEEVLPILERFLDG